MLRIQDACQIYRHRGVTVTALDHVTLDIESGDFICVVGPSGSGKSTLLLTLGGMLSPSHGRVILDEISIYDLSAAERAGIRRDKIGFVFQTFNLVPYLSALENVKVPLLFAGIDAEQQSTRAIALLNKVDLSDRLDHKPSELSVGQQQRVALARMLANEPEIILADEPTGNLDPETSQQVIDFLVDINEEGRTIVVVTHDPRIASRAKKSLRLVEGSIFNNSESSSDFARERT